MLLLGSYGGQTGLNFCQLAILFGRPLLCYFVNFSATLQQYSRPYSLQNFYLHNLAQRCLYTLQLSNFLNNDFSSLKVRITANEIDFYLRGKMLLYRRQKMRQAIQRGNPRKADAAKTGSFTKSPGKGAQSVIAIIRLNQGENFFAQPTHPVGQKTLSSVFQKI